MFYPTPNGQPIYQAPTPTGQAIPSQSVGNQMAAVTHANNPLPHQSSPNPGTINPVQVASFTNQIQNIQSALDQYKAGQQPANQSNIASSLNQPASTESTAITNPYLSQVQSLEQLSPGEINAQQDLINLQNSYTTGNQGVQDRTIPMQFITGEQQSLTNQYNNAQVPLQQKLALAQSQRQASLDAAKSGLDYSLKQQELSKPVFGNLGTTGYQLNPDTGQYESIGGTGGEDVSSILGQLGAAGVPITNANRPALIEAIQNGATPDSIIQAQANAAGTKAAATTGSGYKFNPATGVFEQPHASTTSIPSSSGGALLGGFTNTQAVKDFQSAHGLVADGIVGPKTRAAMDGETTTVAPITALSSGALTRLTTGDFRTGDKYSTQQNAIDAEIRKQFPNFNPQVAKANAKAINDQIGSQADVTRGITAADDNFNLLTDTFAQQGVNDLSSPAANLIANKIKTGLLGNSAAINFKSAVSTLQTEYATVLGRGGEVTDSVRKSAQNVISGNYSMADLKSLHEYIDKEGKNVINSYTKTINGLVSGSNQGSGGTSGVTSSGIKYTIH